MEPNILTQLLQTITDRVNSAADKAGQKVENFIKNDDALRPILITAHSRLPMIIRLVIKEHRFVEFILKNREKLLIHHEVQKLVQEILNNFRK